MDGYTFEPKLKEKRWSKDFEEEIRDSWKNETWWRFDPNSEAPVFVIDTPPPYPAPIWHMGAIGYALQDIIARAYRMLGYNVLFPIGIDRNGIPIEWYVEKYEHINMWKYDRSEFEKLCKKYLDEWTEMIKRTMQKYGVFGDYVENYYETDSPEYRAITQKSFKILWDKGLIYEAERPNFWCPHCKTTIALAEVEYKERQGKLYYLKYKVVETGEDLIVATTRPELLAGCRAILVHPDDERYKHLHGKHAIVPIYGNKVPIVATVIHVGMGGGGEEDVEGKTMPDPNFGTGAVHICSFGDWSDVVAFRELGLEPVKVIGEDGKLTQAAGKYAGMTVEEARKAIVEELRREGLLVKEEIITHNVPVHDKCKTPIEIIPMKEYYLRQKDFLDALWKYVDEMKWVPERYKHHLTNWLRNVTSDWPISRRRYYATEIPIWTCRKCGYKYVPDDGRYHKPWKEQLNITCPKCGAKDWEGEWRVFDTWFDSSITILYITFWGRDKRLFEKTFKKGLKLRPQGYDIIRTWLYYTLLRVHQLEGTKAFDIVAIHGMGLDEKGRKMSKSLGNVVNPEELVDKWGGDTLRLWAASEQTFGENFRVIEEKIAGAQKVLTKFWNIARYVSMYPNPETRPELLPLDHWILSLLNKVREEVITYYKELNLNKAARTLRWFTWNVFADHYIELTKRRARMDGFSEEEARAAWWTLHTALRTLLLLWAPIIPATTDKIWRELYGERSIHYERFPENVKGVKDYSDLTERIMAFDSLVWKTKKERNIKFYEPIKGIEIPEELKVFEKDLIATHRLS